MRSWGTEEGEESRKTLSSQILRTVINLFIYLIRYFSYNRVSSKTVFKSGVMKLVDIPRKILIEDNRAENVRWHCLYFKKCNFYFVKFCFSLCVCKCKCVHVHNYMKYTFYLRFSSKHLKSYGISFLWLCLIILKDEYAPTKESDSFVINRKIFSHY